MAELRPHPTPPPNLFDGFENESRLVLQFATTLYGHYYNPGAIPMKPEWLIREAKQFESDLLVSGGWAGYPGEVPPWLGGPRLETEPTVGLTDFVTFFEKTATGRVQAQGYGDRAISSLIHKCRSNLTLICASCGELRGVCRCEASGMTSARATGGWLYWSYPKNWRVGVQSLLALSEHDLAEFSPRTRPRVKAFIEHLRSQHSEE